MGLSVGSRRRDDSGVDELPSVHCEIVTALPLVTDGPVTKNQST